MKREILDELAAAGYEARCEKLVSGTYQGSAQLIPSSGQFFHWDDLEGKPFENAVKSLYRAQAQASVDALLFTIMTQGTPAAKQALEVVLAEMKDQLFTDKEQAERGL